MELKVGDKVQWASQAAGYTKAKEGVVALVVPPSLNPCNVIRDTEVSHVSCQFDGMARNHESYLVLVTGVKGGKKLYWPRVSSLQKVEAPPQG
jgi:hypothetical protein